MPEIKSHGYLLQYLQDIGYYQSLGMGMSPISYTEIKAYVDLMGLDLTIFEVSTLREMSIAYVSAYNDNYTDTLAPYDNVITVDELEAIINKAESFKK